MVPRYLKSFLDPFNLLLYINGDETNFSISPILFTYQNNFQDLVYTWSSHW